MFSTCLFVRPSIPPFVRPFLCYQTGERGISIKSEPILMQIGTRGSWDNGIKRSTLGSEVKVTEG